MTLVFLGFFRWLAFHADLLLVEFNLARPGGESCTTAELKKMAEWLTQCGIRTVAMQSTGVYCNAFHYVAVPPSRDPQPVRCFGRDTAKSDQRIVGGNRRPVLSRVCTKSSNAEDTG